MRNVPEKQLRVNLDSILTRQTERIVISRRGKPCAVLVGIEDLRCRRPASGKLGGLLADDPASAGWRKVFSARGSRGTAGDHRREAGSSRRLPGNPEGIRDPRSRENTSPSRPLRSPPTLQLSCLIGTKLTQIRQERHETLDKTVRPEQRVWMP